MPSCAGHLLVLRGVGRQLPVLHGEGRDQERPHLSAAPVSRDDGSEQGGGERCEFVFTTGVRQKQQQISLFYPDQDFISQWSLGNEAATEDASASQLGLAWLIPLWVDRDQEVLGKKKFSALSPMKRTRSLFSPFALQLALANIPSVADVRRFFLVLFCLFADA